MNRTKTPTTPHRAARTEHAEHRGPRRLLAAGVAAAALALGTTALLSSAAHAHPGHHGTSDAASDPDLGAVRHATAKYRTLSVAKKDDYAKLRDAAGIACIDDPAGGMGVHFVNGDLVGDAKVKLRHPEALVYHPSPRGPELGALEYIVFKKAWRGEHPTGRPHLLGHEFELVKEGNRYGLPAFYELHVWAWTPNEAGLFDDWNPVVDCR